jgi:hypothetical protein
MPCAHHAPSQATYKAPDLTEINRTCLVLFDMNNNRTFGPYSKAMHRTLISVMPANNRTLRTSATSLTKRACTGCARNIHQRTHLHEAVV